MKKIFTLVFALMGFAGAASAATVDDLAVLKHSYVLVCDNLGARPGKGVLFGDDHFLDVTGGSTATNKGVVDLSVVDGNEGYVTQEIVDKYGADYAGEHYNWLRLKNTQDMIALKLTAKSKIIMFIQGNNKEGKDARIPRISTAADLSVVMAGNEAPAEGHPATISGYRWEYTVDDDGLFYIGSYNGDMFVSYIIIEANEAPGTPTVKVGPQTFENGLWFREVSAKANDMIEEGSTEAIPTIITYTTDGSAPTAASPVYTEPIKCYGETTVKFQAFMNFGDGKADDANIADGADNEGSVSFVFDAPTIAADGANVTITSPYAEQNGENYYTLNGGDEVKGDAATLTESATVAAYTKIVNGEYGTFTSKSTSKDVYVLNPIKEAKTIKVTAGEVVVDEEATATSTTGTIYKVEGGEISADKADFFVKNLTFTVVNGDNAKYQVPEGQEAYIQMSNTNITFLVAEGDSVNVKVTTTLNSCKTLNPDNDESITTDRKNYVNISGTTYGNDDVTAEGGNVIEFGLPAGTWTFQKYSGTGNIIISSIEITPAAAETAETELTLTEGHTLLISDIEAAGGTDEDKIVFYIENGSGESREGWGIGGFANSDNWSPIESWTAPAGDNFTFEYTVAKIKEVAGTTPGEWHDVGITINIYNDCKVAKVTLVKGGATAIQTAKTVNTVNGVRYNLAGQKVDENYKGIVILNGKKFMQK